MTNRPGRQIRTHRLVLGGLILVGLAALGCQPESHPADPGAGTWAEGLPNPTIEGATEGNFWAAVPDGQGAQILLLQAALEAATEPEPAALVWRDALGRQVEVPSALIHRIPDGDSSSTGVVNALIPGQGIVIGRRVESGKDQVRLDWNGQSIETTASAMWSPEQANPWRWVPAADDRPGFLALLLAEHDDRLWLLGPDGRVETVATGLAQPWQPRQNWQAGEAVNLYTWADGIQAGEVVEVIEEGFRYRVRDSDGHEHTPAIDRLLAAD